MGGGFTRKVTWGRKQPACNWLALAHWRTGTRWHVGALRAGALAHHWHTGGSSWSGGQGPVRGQPGQTMGGTVTRNAAP